MRVTVCRTTLALLMLATSAFHGMPEAAVFAKVSPPSAKAKGPTDAQIRRQMIKESITNYPGNCPCPYSVAANGSSCGKRSAWSRAGGESPLCYPSDISAEMVAEYRANHQED